MRDELSLRVVECVNHFQSTAPEDVAELERTLERYDRLREEAGVNRRMLEEPSRLLPGVLGHLQAGAEALLGAIPALFGFVTGLLPYVVTSRMPSPWRPMQRRWSKRSSAPGSPP